MTLFKSMMAACGLMLLMTGAVHAKDAPKMALPAAEAKADARKADANAKTAPMDINTASAKELATLPKIGDVRAAAIVKGRPYKAKDELVDKKILTDETYAAVKDLIIAKHKSGKNKPAKT